MDQQFYTYLHDIAGQFEVFSYIPPDWFLSPFVKNVPPVVLFWILWLFPYGDIAVTRQKLITTVFVAATAVFTGRALNMALPFKLRPMYDPTVTQSPVVNVDLSEWSAFPSDHAALFFSLALCFLLINRFAGILALFHAIFIVSIPRILLGFHWPSDILGGAAIGIVVALLLMGFVGMRFDRTQVYTSASRHPFILYPVLIFVTMQIAVMFSTVRLVVSKLFSLIA